jgi:hypothetical protein
MLYTRKVFSCPASSGGKTTDKNWDRAFLSKEEFAAKYPSEATTAGDRGQ